MPAASNGKNAGERQSVRIGVVGLGYWGPNLVRNLHELPQAEVVIICDRRRDALRTVGTRYPGVERTRHFDDLLEDASVEAIAIATPVSTHYELALAALEAGKHVFVEKPFASSTAEARELIDVAERNKLVIMPGHTFLYSPPVNFIRDLITKGALGDVYFISTSRVNLGLHQPDVSVVWDLGPHDFSILRYWLGEMPTRVSALSRSCVLENTPDVAFIDLEFPSGTIAHVELSWLAPSKLRRTAIVGSHKMLVYDDTSSEPVRIFDSGAELPNPESYGEYKLTYRTGDIVSPRIDVTEPLALELTDFLAAVRGRSEPRSNAKFGFDVIEMMEAVEASLSAGGRPVDVGSLRGRLESPA